MKLFAQIRKVDEEKRLVYGRVAEEVVDKADEVMDYLSSKPHFEKWSADISKDSGGKNLGNVRAMHGKIAAGMLKSLDFDDVAKTIDVVAHITDDQEWKKCLTGTYTGFSMGGSYVGDKKVEKMDGRDVTRYTAKPSEVSLVDRPCIPTATFFEVQKGDGTLRKVDFVKPEPDDQVTGTADEIKALGKAMNSQGLSIADVLAKIAARDDTSPKAGESKYGDVEFADEKNKKYPLDTAEHVKAAASYFGKQANRDKYDAADQKTIDGKIATAEKKFKIGDADKADFVLPLRKGLYTCGTLAQMLASIQYIISSVEYEEATENDSSPIGAQLMQWLADGGKILGDMVTEEVAEATAGLTDGAAVVPELIVLSERAGSLNKLLDADLKKVGARNSKADQQRIQAMHDHSTALGANCAAADDDAAKAAKAAAAADLAKASDPAELKKAEEAAALAKVAEADKLVKVTAARELLKASVLDPEHLAKKSDDEILKLADALEKHEQARNERFEKLLTERTAPLLEKITRLEAQPEAPRVSLRALGKAEDTVSADAPAVAKVEAVKDSHGQEHEAASLIKSLHASGGTPLVRQLKKQA